MEAQRFDRNVRFFGTEGQQRIRQMNVAIVGVGGTGTHVVQQLALLGVGHLILIDGEQLEETNRNRYIGARFDDVVPGTYKTEIAKRLTASIDPDISVSSVCRNFITDEGFSAVRAADYVFGCLDTEGARMVLMQLCAAYCKPYFDLATEILDNGKSHYGGRVCFSGRGEGCLLCLGELDAAEAGMDLADENARRNREQIYGVQRKALGGSGPSVVSLNGVIASLGVTEFMVEVTGLRPALRLLKYYAHNGKVTVPVNPPFSDCYICKGLYGRQDKADVQRYIRELAAHTSRR